LLAAAAHAQADCGAHKDFLVRSDPTLAPVRPVDCFTTSQTPPEFTWPPRKGDESYQVIVKFPDGRAESRTTTRNWLLWDAALPAGTYTWQVRVTGADEDLSEPRRFTITPDAVPFVVPGPGTILVRARGAARPRTWPHDSTSPLLALRNERAKGFNALLEGVVNDEKRREAEPTSPSINSNYDDAVAEQKRTLAAALAWAGTHDRRHGEDAARRLMAQAAWSTAGAISYKANDTANRTVAFTLALGFDWTYDYLSAQQKQAITAAIRARTQPMFEDILEKVTAYPYDSHGNVTLNTVAAIGTLMAGELAEADNWVKEAVPAAAAWTSPWGWQDGGFGNGTAQAFWDTGSNLTIWYVLRNAAGVDLSKKEWVRNHARFLAYFVPPGAPSGAFGDGLEMPLAEVWSRVGKALAAFSPSPLARWYARSQSREDPARLELLLAPHADFESARFPQETPDSAFFPSIGWVAMHSSFSDPNRLSIFFKSSPYGSYNHSHGDQNSFVIHHKGRRLAIASGYYDDYGTRHWYEWYKQTRAANAITFDGGQGQGQNDRAFAGEVTRFESGDGYDYAIGRADRAYDGKVTRAERSIVYLRPATVVVYDSLASPAPHTWEWNIHAINRMTPVTPTRVAIRNGPAQMCVEMVSGPETRFTQGDQFTARPSAGANQWHGTFATTAKSSAAEFVVVMRIGSDCGAAPRGGAPAGAKRAGDAMEVSVDGRVVRFSRDAVSVK
jgi:YD repeat-containing protein